MIKQERAVNEAFSKKSKVYEEYGKRNRIVQWTRQQVYEHISAYLQPQSLILELNGGTGEDALHFAKRGHTIHIVELADGMIDKIRDKIDTETYDGKITYQQMSFVQLEKLKRKGPYDHIFSNFGGLNLTNQPQQVFKYFSEYLKPGGLVTLVMLSPFCLWEILTIFWSRKTALRRIPSWFGNAVPSRVSGVHVNTYYFKPGHIRKLLGDKYRVVDLKGLSAIVPPSYYDTFPKKYPSMFRLQQRIEQRLRRYSPISHIGDFYIITLQYKGENHYE